jgi:hypothetical protein
MPRHNTDNTGPFSAPVGQRGRRGIYGNRGVNRISHLYNNSEDNPSDSQSCDTIEPVTAFREPIASAEQESTGPCNPKELLATLQSDGTTLSDRDRALSKARIRELEHKNLCHATERTELKSQLHLMAEKQRAAESQWAEKEEERVQRAVDSRVQTAVETERRQWREEIARVCEGAREEMEAERQWWREEIARIQQEGKAEMEKIRKEARDAAKERIRAGIRQAERDLALLDMDP